jgi:hypothetical protein
MVIAGTVATAWKPFEIRQVRSHFRAAAAVRPRSVGPVAVILASTLVVPNHLRSVSHEVTNLSVACVVRILHRVLGITGEFTSLVFVCFSFFH